MSEQKSGWLVRKEYLESTGQAEDIGMVKWHLIFANGSRAIISEVEPGGAVRLFEDCVRDAYLTRDNPSKAEGLMSKEDASKYIEIWENTIFGELHAILHPDFVQKLVEAGVGLSPPIIK